MSQTEKRQYAVILFPEETKGGMKVVDMVPMSWLVEMPNGKWNCYYPPKEETDVDRLVKELMAPSTTWKQYPAEIIKKAGDYETGLRRLQRAYENLNVVSTATESAKEDDPYTDEFEDTDLGNECDDRIIQKDNPVAKERTLTKKKAKAHLRCLFERVLNTPFRVYMK